MKIALMFLVFIFAIISIAVVPNVAVESFQGKTVGVAYTKTNPGQEYTFTTLYSNKPTDTILSGPGQMQSYVPGELIIKFTQKSGIDSESKAAQYLTALLSKKLILSASTADIERVIKKQIPDDELGLSRIFKLKVSENVDLSGLIKEYESRPEVEYAEPNFIAYTAATPNDSRYSEQWAHQNMQSELAWDIERGDSNITIAIVDTGVSYNHTDLAENIWINSGEDLNKNGISDPSDFNGLDDDNNSFIDDIRGYDFVNLGSPSYCKTGEDCVDEDNDPSDFYGHGTHVSGIAAAVTNNSIGIAGVCWSCKIMPVRAGYMDPNGYGVLQYADIVQGIFYAANSGADVISMSFVGGESQSMKNALDYAYSKGLVLVAAAGNSNTKYKSYSYPAAYDNVIAVAATQQYDNRSDWGGGFASNYGSWVDVAAPGTAILSTLPGNNYASWSGTSMATPHVAGLAGLILSKNPNLTKEEVRNILRTGIDIPISDKYIGTGRINAFKALQINSIPIANLEPSLDDQILSGNGTINITGTAAGTNFVNYFVEYGEGAYPFSWTILQNSTNTSVINGALATFDTYSVMDGEYSIKLTVKNSDGQVSEDKAVVYIDNNFVIEPLSYDIYRAGDLIYIKATIGKIQSLNIEYAPASSPENWSSERISIFNITPPVNNIAIASWDTAAITKADYYTVRLNLSFAFGQATEYIKNIFLDPTMKSGWPKRFDYELVIDPSFGPTYYYGGYLEPSVGDINNDSKKEIVIYKGGEPPKLYVFQANGSLLQGWPVTVGTKAFAGGNLHKPLISDLDNDSAEEIIVITPGFSAKSTAYAFKGNGSLLQGWPVNMPASYKHTLLSKDLDLDGRKEVIIYNAWSANGTIVVLGSNGTIISQWDLEPRSWIGSIEGTPAAGNFDNDPELEIVSVQPSKYAGYNFTTGVWNSTGVIYVHNMNGSVVSGWPKYTDGIIFSSPVVGDINKDGYEEIIVGLMYASNIYPDYRYGGLYVFDRNGTVLPGWPFNKGYQFWSTPSLADFNGDGYLEIAASTTGYETYVLYHNGTIAPNWPQYKTWADYYSSIIADINDDKIPDIITTAGNGFSPSISYHGGVYAWNFNGSLMPGFPKVTEVDAQGPPLIDDLEKDGKLELLASSNYNYDWDTGKSKRRGTVYVWDLNASFRQPTMHWPQFHHDAQHTGLYTKPYLCGDVNGDGKVNLSDIIYLVNYLFKGGPSPVPLSAGDANGDGKINLSDIVYLVNYLFKGGPAPCA